MKWGTTNAVCSVRSRGLKSSGPTLITTPPDFLVIIWWFQYRDRISSGISTLTFHRDNHSRPSIRPYVQSPFMWNLNFFTHDQIMPCIISRNYALYLWKKKRRDRIVFSHFCKIFRNSCLIVRDELLLTEK